MVLFVELCLAFIAGAIFAMTVLLILFEHYE